jgi:hypothetical protein
VSRAVAGVLAVDRGLWRFRPRDNVGLGAVEPVDVILSNATFHSILDHDALFSAILQGMILVRVEFASIRARLELLGEGDMISPWHGMDPQPTAPRLITARVISNLEIALLDRRFTPHRPLDGNQQRGDAAAPRPVADPEHAVRDQLHARVK